MAFKLRGCTTDVCAHADFIHLCSWYGDGFYSNPAVSRKQNSLAGFGGLAPVANNTNNPFEYAGDIMIWSVGPDLQANSADTAVSGSNKDNILSWE